MPSSTISTLVMLPAVAVPPEPALLPALAMLTLSLGGHH